MHVKGLTWLGVRTTQFEEMVKFFRDVMGMQPIRDEAEIAGFQLTNGTQVELYRPEEAFHAFFTTGPVGRLLGGRCRRSTSDHGSSRHRVHWSHSACGQDEVESLPSPRRDGV